MKKLIIFLFAMIIVIGANAQNKKFVGLFAGASYYNGDYNKFKPFDVPNLAYGIMYSHSLDYYTTIRIQGNGSVLKNSNNDFETQIYDIGLMLEFNLVKFSTDNKRGTFPFAPYIETGAFFLLTPDLKPSVNVSIPLGIGVKYAISEKAVIAFEWNYHITNTDMLDNILNEPEVLSRKIALTNDYYSFVGLVFKFNFFTPDYLCPAYM